MAKPNQTHTHTHTPGQDSEHSFDDSPVVLSRFWFLGLGGQIWPGLCGTNFGTAAVHAPEPEGTGHSEKGL